MHLQLGDVLSDVPTTTAHALRLFDDAPAVDPEFMIGTWRGAELPTGHPMDGLLAATGWWGKQFLDAETVHPLLFPTRDGSALWAANPGRIPMGAATLPLPRPTRPLRAAFTALQPVLATHKPRARLRTTGYRGTNTATMVYDQLPINDVFRRLPSTETDAVLGAMDLRGSARPYFFVLQRVTDPPPVR